jgi:hypothetical protein
MSALNVLKMMDVCLTSYKYSEVTRPCFISIANTFSQNHSYRHIRQDKTGQMFRRMKYNQLKYSLCFILPYILCMIFKRMYHYILISKHIGDVSSESNLDIIFCLRGARCGAVGWGTALQAGSIHVGVLEFFIYIILPAALWPWGWLSL